MNTKDLKKLLREKNPTTINIIGNEQLLVKEALATIKEYYIEPGFEDFDYALITDESEAEILTLVSELPMSKMKLIVFTEGAAKYLKGKPNTTCIVSCNNELKDAELEVDCKKLWGRNLTNYIKQKAKEYNLEFDAADVHKFMNFVDNDLSAINNELFKLSFLPNKNRSTIELLEEGNISSKLDSFLTAFANKDSALALQTFYDLHNFGSQQSKIFGFVVFVLKTLLKNIYLDEEDPEADRKYHKVKDKFDFKALSMLLIRLEKIDLDVKQGTIDFAIPLKYLIDRNFNEFDAFVAKMKDDFV